MSYIVKNNYKKILLVVSVILFLLVCPTLIEIIFKSGNIVGTIIRYYTTNGICF